MLIHRAGFESIETRGIPGTIHSIREETIQVHTGQGLLSLMEVQMEGRRPMSSKELLRGFPIKVGDRLGV